MAGMWRWDMKRKNRIAGWRRAETVSLLLSPRWRRGDDRFTPSKVLCLGWGSDDDRYAENKAGVNAHLPNRNRLRG
jgi:hypothetical protein